MNIARAPDHALNMILYACQRMGSSCPFRFEITTAYPVRACDCALSSLVLNQKRTSIPAKNNHAVETPITLRHSFMPFKMYYSHAIAHESQHHCFHRRSSICTSTIYKNVKNNHRSISQTTTFFKSIKNSTTIISK